LGWKRVAVTRVKNLYEAERSLRAERAENECRKDLLPTELVDRVEEYLELEIPLAKERLERKRVGENGAKGKAKDRASKAAGTSRPTYEKAKKVKTLAAKDKENFGPIVEEMDRTGKVDRAYKQAKRKEVELSGNDLLAKVHDAKVKLDRLFVGCHKYLATLREVGSTDEMIDWLSDNEYYLAKARAAKVIEQEVAKYQ
jgi:hypothetical protein